MIYQRRQLISAGLTFTLGGIAIMVSSNAAANVDPLTKILQSGKVLRRYGTASDQAIDAYEQQYGTRFSSSYRAFLKRENGLDYSFSFEEAEEAGLSIAYPDMNTFFGIGNGNEHNDLAILTPDMDFHDKRLLPFAPVIGLGGDTCTFLEINTGKYKDTIMYTDGETFSLVEEASFDGKSVDQIVEYFIKVGWMMPVSPSFDALLANYAKMC